MSNMKFLWGLLFISSAAFSHDPVLMNTKDWYLIAGIGDTEYKSSESITPILEFRPVIGAGLPWEGVKLGYGQIYIESAYHYLGRFHQYKRLESGSPHGRPYTHEEVVDALRFNLRSAYPLSEGLLLNFGYGYSYVFSNFNAETEHDTDLSSVKDESYSELNIYMSVGVEFLVTDNFSWQITMNEFSDRFRNASAQVIYNF